MPNIFFTSDLHLNHNNIIKYCKRPFVNSDDMNEHLIENWNSQVNQTDLVFVLGDFLWGKQVERLNNFTERLHGTKILIKGNHDNYKNTQYINAGWKNVTNLLELRLNNYDITLCHYQLMHWNNSHHGAFHLYGHQHDKRQYTPNHEAYKSLGMSERKMNVCIDSNNYKLFSLNEIIEKLKDRPTNWWRENN